jgi:Niemann-Pick C1 protein
MEGLTLENGNYYKLDDFCYRPISDKGCLVTSPMGFWQMNVTLMHEDPDVKFTAQCVPTSESQVCFDSIGVPVQIPAVFGGKVCKKSGDNSDCAPCNIDASAMSVSFLLNNNEYSNTAASAWEKNVLIKYVKSYNAAIDYHTDLVGN